MKRVTLADIAKRAGVHPTSVSMALRDHRDLPAATRERLKALARTMGYTPDPNLSALVAYRIKNGQHLGAKPLAYITNWETREGWKEMPAHAEFFAGASSKAQELGYHLDHFWLSEPGMSPQRLSKVLYSRGITGLVFASQWPTAETPLDFDWSKFCSVKIDYFPYDPPLHNISNDQRAIIQLAIQKTQAAGYRRIGVVLTQPFDRMVKLAWSGGFLADQQRFAPKDRIPIFYTSDPSPDPGTAEGRKLVHDQFEPWFRKYKPDAILSYGPLVKPLLAALNLSFPRDLAFVELFLRDTSGQTAGVRENCSRVGEVAVEILAGQLQQNNFGVPIFPAATLVEGTWFDGASLPIRPRLTLSASKPSVAEGVR